MASTGRFKRFTVVLSMVLLTVTGFAATAHGTGYIVRQYPIALDVVMPKDKAAFKAGENVHVTVKSSGFTGVKIVAKEAATGREEELKAALVKSDGSGSLAPKMWNVPWSTAGKKPGTYTFTVTGLGGAKATPVAKSVTVSVVQPSGPAKITFKEPAAGRQVKPGETVSVAVKASGVDNVEFRVKDLQTGAERVRPNAHVKGTDDYTTSWSAEGSAKGNYRIIARGLGADGQSLAEESVAVSVVEPATHHTITYRKLTPGREVLSGEVVRFTTSAGGLSRLDFDIRDLQTGRMLTSPPLFQFGTEYLIEWRTVGLKGTYQFTARGFGPDGRQVMNYATTLTVTALEPSLQPKGPFHPVPNVVGLTESEALSKLRQAGFGIYPTQFVSTPDAGKWGKVIGQSLSAGTVSKDPLMIAVGRK